MQSGKNCKNLRLIQSLDQFLSLLFVITLLENITPCWDWQGLKDISLSTLQRQAKAGFETLAGRAV